jgi:NADH:ubiquinone oxidoreductase subunit 5 (subunit L)/multisubunit Na+/H+ antiporter MnhA subunit
MDWTSAKHIIPWLIPIPPFLAFFLIMLLTGRSRTVSHILAIGGIGLSWLLSIIEILIAIGTKDLGQP